jgi:hypothetical protein
MNPLIGMYFAGNPEARDHSGALRRNMRHFEPFWRDMMSRM